MEYVELKDEPTKQHNQLNGYRTRGYYHAECFLNDNKERRKVIIYDADVEALPVKMGGGGEGEGEGVKYKHMKAGKYVLERLRATRALEEEEEKEKAKGRVRCMDRR